MAEVKSATAFFFFHVQSRQGRPYWESNRPDLGGIVAEGRGGDCTDGQVHRRRLPNGVHQGLEKRDWASGLGREHENISLVRG